MSKTHVVWSNSVLASDPPFEPDYYIVTVQDAKRKRFEKFADAKLFAYGIRKKLPPMKKLEVLAIKEVD